MRLIFLEMNSTDCVHILNMIFCANALRKVGQNGLFSLGKANTLGEGKTLNSKPE